MLFSMVILLIYRIVISIENIFSISERTAVFDSHNGNSNAGGGKKGGRGVPCGDSTGRNPYMSTLWHDLRFAFRTLGKSKGFAAIVVLTLAVGISVNATVFAIANTWMFKGFPVDRNDLILYLGSRDLSTTYPWGPASYPDFRDWRDQAKSFSGIGAANFVRTNLSDDAGLPDTYRGVSVTANTFHVLGVKPFAGRDFSPQDEAPGAAPVVILSYGVWEHRYGKDRSIVGHTTRINGISTTVIGIMPNGMKFPFDNDLWIPLIPTPDLEKRDQRTLFVYGRMAEGATPKSARAEMATIGQNLQQAYPLTNQGFAPVALTYSEFFNGPDAIRIFGAMFVAVCFVLLIACANVANLLLARAAARSREISIRIALGAGRWRLVRQLLVESLLLAIMAGIAGWWIATRALRVFAAVTISMRPTWWDFSADYRMLIYLMAISVGTALLFGLAPALRLSKLDVNSGLKDSGRGTSGGVHAKKLSNVLVIVEMGMAVVLLAGAGLMIRSFLNIYRAPLGVSVPNVLTMRLVLPPAKYPQPSDQIAFHQRLKERLKALPGVEWVAIVNALPTGGSAPYHYELEGAPAADPQHRPSLSAIIASPDYFNVMSVSILRGRDFTDADGVAGALPVAIVNERFATQFWPGQDPVGKRLRLYDGTTPEAWLTVVALVPNIVQNDITPRQIDPLIYVPYRQKPQADMAIVARTRVPPGTMSNTFRREIQATDSDLPIYNLWTLPERLERNYWFYEMMGALFGIFAGIALLLAAVGLYAVMAHSVNQRTREIGVRMALGASASNIRALVFRQGMRPMVIGLIVGLAGGFAMTRVLRSILISVSPADPSTFAIATLVLVGAAALGCLVPALTATKVDPIVALRDE
jgi:putative ABC transport system permease protein